MTGTSLDALDLALIEVRGHGVTLNATVHSCASVSLGDLTVDLRKLADQQPMSSEDIAHLSHKFGLLHLNAVRTLIEDDTIDLVAVHGQTLFHKPPVSWQLINPSIIAHDLNVPVIYDLRAADLACGGEGAPITPIADYILFHSPIEKRTVINFGGFINVTHLPDSDDPTQIQGGDVCVCNQFLDRLSRELLRQPFDRDGEASTSGLLADTPNHDLVKFLDNQIRENRSLGTGDEITDWLHKYKNRYAPNDLLRTACAAIASSVWRSVQSFDPKRLIVAGGGVHNRALMRELESVSSVPIEHSDYFGIQANYREAVAMALLGALCQDRIPITLSQVTGNHAAPVSGCWVLP